MVVIRDNLSKKQRKTLVARLRKDGFTVGNFGHIDVVDVKEGHPGWDTDTSRHPLPRIFR